jgi:hypothetical protein
LKPDLEATLGEPTPASVDAFGAAFDELGLTIPFLQCGDKPLPLTTLSPRVRAASFGVARTAESPR